MDDAKKIERLQDCAELMARIAMTHDEASIQAASKVLAKARKDGWTDASYFVAFERLNLLYAQAPLSSAESLGLKTLICRRGVLKRS